MAEAIVKGLRPQATAGPQDNDDGDVEDKGPAVLFYFSFLFFSIFFSF